jgi:hypothetical protein
MTSPSGFQKLPRELRDQVYADYFAIEGGYRYGYTTNKLITSRGTGVDLDVRLTCRQVAAETRGLALKLNTINFSTVCDESLRQRAGQFDAIQKIISDLKTKYLLRSAPKSGLISATTRDYVESHHPEFLSAVQTLHNFNTNLSSHRWKEIASQTRHFIASTLKDMAGKLNFGDTVSRDMHWKTYRPEPNPLPIIAHSHEPWILPNEDEMADMLNLIAPLPVEATRRFDVDRYWDKRVYRLSAATASIRFLRSVPAELRLAMRRLVLHEDRQSVAWPECHGQGLIAFCQENSDLRIERRVGLWRTILPAASMPVWSLMTYTFANIQRYKYDHLEASCVSRGHNRGDGVAGWIMEALALTSLGMPTDSFELVIDGMSTPDISTQVFDVVQRDAAWQSAYERCIKAPISQSPRLNWMDIRDNDAYVMRGFPEAVQEICGGKSLVSCNFDTGFVHDIDQIAAQGRTWTEREWRENWYDNKRLVDIHTVSPLPSWLELLQEELLIKVYWPDAMGRACYDTRDKDM